LDANDRGKRWDVGGAGIDLVGGEVEVIAARGEALVVGATIRTPIRG